MAARPSRTMPVEARFGDEGWDITQHPLLSSRPAAPIKSACTWPISATRWLPIPVYGHGLCHQVAPAARQSARDRRRRWAGRRCTPRNWGSSTRLPATKCSSPPRCRPIWRNWPLHCSHSTGRTPADGTVRLSRHSASVHCLTTVLSTPRFGLYKPHVHRCAVEDAGAHPAADYAGDI